MEIPRNALDPRKIEEIKQRFPETPEETLVEVFTKAALAKEAWKEVSVLKTEKKNTVLLKAASLIREKAEEIKKANSKDMERGKQKGLSKALLDRLLLNDKRIEGLAKALEDVASLRDPVGEGETWTLPNGLVIARKRVPIGVIGMIYEARPNVTVDAFGLAFKAGNTVVLRGSSDALESNKILVSIIKEALKDEGITEYAVNLIEDATRASVLPLIRARDYLDLVIPRGGAGLIKFVVENATVPSIETGAGICHVFVNHDADIEMAVKIVDNAKTQRPAVCNAAETLLVHSQIAEKFLPAMAEVFAQKGVEMRCDERSLEIIKKAGYEAVPATEEDWATEYLDLIISIKVVDSVEEAIDHINTYGTKHSESIITSNLKDARKFQEEVDASTVYVNTSTRFTDGGEFGFGAEIGISTQKLHARGPMGLRELTTIKYYVFGEGQIRK